MRLAMLALMAVTLGINGQCACAQDTTRRTLAKELLNEMHMKENIEKSFAMMKKMMPRFAKMAQTTKKGDASSGETETTEEEKAAKMGAEMAAKLHAKTFDTLSKEMSWDALKEDYVTIYAETYSEEELKGLIEFYKSPIGQAFTKKQPELMKRSMVLMQKRMMKWMPKIQAMSKDMMESMHSKEEKATSPVPPPVADPVGPEVPVEVPATLPIKPDPQTP